MIFLDSLFPTMSNSPRNLRDIFADAEIYERELEEERKKRRMLLISELTEQNRERAFVVTLGESSARSLRESTFEEWLPFWESLSPDEQAYLEEAYRKARMQEGEWGAQSS